MMRIEYDLDSWQELLDVLPDLTRRFYENRDVDDNLYLGQVPSFLYRGQGDANWDITTTLQRSAWPIKSLSRYLDACQAAYAEISAFTGTEWPGVFEQRPRLTEDTDEYEKLHHRYHPFLPCLEYLVYLRHHGFPSPLLDWSKSPFVAAWMAFSPSSKVERVAIYVFLRSLTLTVPIGGEWIDVPTVRGRSHSRYFRQQCEYTMAVGETEKSDEHRLISYEKFVEVSGDPLSRDNLFAKITLPFSERRTALDYLDLHNINEYTLFDTEDAMVWSVGDRVFRKDMDHVPADWNTWTVGKIIADLGVADSSE